MLWFFFSAQPWPPPKRYAPHYPIIICALHKLMTHPLWGGLFLISFRTKMLARKFCEIVCGWGRTRGKNRFLKVSNGFCPTRFLLLPLRGFWAGFSSSCSSFCYLHTSSCVLWHVPLDFARWGSRSPSQRFMSLSSVCFFWVAGLCVCFGPLNPILPLN